MFGVGQPSFFKWRESRSLGIEACEQAGIASLVLATLEASVAQLPEPYGQALRRARGEDVRAERSRPSTT